MALIIKRPHLGNRFNIAVIPKPVLNDFLEKHLHRVQTGFRDFTTLVQFRPVSQEWDIAPSEEDAIDLIVNTLQGQKLLLRPQQRVTIDVPIPMVPYRAIKVRSYGPVTRDFESIAVGGDLIISVEKYWGSEKKILLARLSQIELVSLGERAKLQYYFQKYPGDKLLLYIITHMHVSFPK